MHYRVVADTTKVRIFKQITTSCWTCTCKSCCCWYHKGTNFQANHNLKKSLSIWVWVVADTTKVRIFKQITTYEKYNPRTDRLLLIPQRYEFSSKSQLNSGSLVGGVRCCWYHKGTNFQANHNTLVSPSSFSSVVADTTKVRIFKQITTYTYNTDFVAALLLIPQRYEFSSKSQLRWRITTSMLCCCWYHKGTNFQANHNWDDV